MFGKMTIKVAGTTFDGRQGKLFALKKAEREGQEKIFLTLRREPRNERDRNAIAVLAHTAKSVFKIGYIPADVALWLAPKMDAGLIARCYACKDGEGRPMSYVTGGGRLNMGAKFTLIHELQAELAKVAMEAEAETDK